MSNGQLDCHFVDQRDKRLKNTQGISSAKILPLKIKDNSSRTWYYAGVLRVSKQCVDGLSTTFGTDECSEDEWSVLYDGPSICESLVIEVKKWLFVDIEI